MKSTWPRKIEFVGFGVPHQLFSAVRESSGRGERNSMAYLENDRKELKPGFKESPFFPRRGREPVKVLIPTSQPDMRFLEIKGEDLSRIRPVRFSTTELFEMIGEPFLIDIPERAKFWILLKLISVVEYASITLIPVPPPCEMMSFPFMTVSYTHLTLPTKA